jgi:hypothetical protein
MKKQILRLRTGLVIFLGILVLSSSAFAMVDRTVISREGNRVEERHYYRDGRWYRHDARGNEIFVSDIAPGVYIEALPPQHTTIVIEGTSYYHDNSHYYRPAPHGGYVVVAPPVTVRPRSQNNDNGRTDRGDNSRNGENRDQRR